jgi:hypothetical protein
MPGDDRLRRNRRDSHPGSRRPPRALLINRATGYNLKRIPRDGGNGWKLHDHATAHRAGDRA